MKKTIHSVKTWIASGLLVASLGANAQTIPTGQYAFPQNVEYAFGYKATGAKTETEAKKAYEAWKAGYLVAGPSCAGAGTQRVKFDTKSGRFTSRGVSSTGADIVTVSEGIAYGMLLSSYYGDQAIFDGLWAYYKKHRNPATGIMNWGINNTACTVVGDNGATDAELDVAWALWVAHNQWGNGSTSTYLSDAIAMIKIIKNLEIDKSGNLNTLKPGDQFGGHGTGNNDLVNISYFSPAYYRTFGDITGDVAFWDKVYTRGYDILEKAANKTTGLVPDWCTSSGATPASGAATYDDAGVNFFYDAVRTPARTALDYLWYGDQAPRALAYTKKVSTWLRGAHPNPASIGSKYATAGGPPLESYHNNSFVGPFTVCAMATDDINTSSYISALYNDNVKTTPGVGEYFNASWKAISLFMATGNFYLPPPDACDGPYLDASYQLCQGTGSPKTITMNSQAPGATKYEWKRNGVVIPGASSQTYSTSIAGNYEVATTYTVSGKACVRRSATTVFDATPTAKFTFTRNGLAVDFKNTSTGGDPYSDPVSLTSEWTFGANSTPPTSATADGATNYGTAGLKLVTLKVTNVCNQTSTYTEQLPLPTASGQGWMMTDFSKLSNTVGEISAYVGSSKSTHVAFDSSCQYAVVKIKKTMAQNDAVALTIKSDTALSTAPTYYKQPIDISGYPFARFRVKFKTASGTPIDSIRVDLASWSGPTTNVYTYNGSAVKDRVFLKGPRNADGTYQKIPNDQWFVSTLSFEGKMSASGFDSKRVTQLSFIPYSQYLTSTGRQDFDMYVDWATVGNKDIPLPNPSISGSVNVCSTSPSQPISGSDLDSCNTETILWADGVTKFARILNPGTYTYTVSNFAGSVSKTLTVSSQQPANPNFGFTVTRLDSAQLLPTDSSTGGISQWKWYRGTSTTVNATTTATAISSNYTGTTSNWLYNTSAINSMQNPGLSPIKARSTNTAFLYQGTKFTGTEFLCLVVNPKVTNCVITSKLCKPIKWVIVTSVEETLTESTFAIYPTVVTDNRLNVQLGTGLQGAYDVQVMNVSGTQVAGSKAISGNNEIILDSNLPAGTYIVKVSQGDKTITKRFIKQ